MKKIILLLVFISPVICFQAAAQEKLKRSGELINEAIVLHDNEEYEKAIQLYMQIDVADTNYFYMLSEAALTYYKLKNYDKAIECCNKVLEDNPKSGVNIYSTLGSVWDDNENPQKSIEVYNKGLTYYPYSHLLHYNIGITLYKEKKYAEAIVYFQKTLKLNPFHLGSHYMLGLISALQGNYTHAFLNWTTFLLIQPKGKSANNVLQFLEQISSGNLKTDDLPEIPASLTTNAFSDLDFILKSKVALNKKYKSSVKIDAALVKQIKLLIEKFKYDNASDDFWMEFYGPLFNLIKTQNYYEPLTYFMITSAKISNAEKWVKKNDKKIKEFLKNCKVEFDKINDTRLVDVKGKQEKLKAWYFNDNTLQALGNIDDNDDQKKTGFWQLFNSNGNLRAEGTYNKQYKKEGVWKYYNKFGNIETSEEFDSNGLLNGTLTNYYESGAVQSKYNYINNKKEGEAQFYYSCGSLYGTSIYKNDKINGTEKLFSYKGTLTEQANFTDGELNGILLNYYSNGKKKGETEYLNNAENGLYIRYNKDETVTVKGSAKNAKAVGEWKYYYDDGTLKTEEFYDEEGTLSGLLKNYDKYGRLDEEKKFEKGKLVSEKNYNLEDGKLWYYITYNSNEKIASLVYFDKENKEKANYKLQKNNNQLTGYYPNGEKFFEGELVDGEKNGKWVYFFKNGNILSENYFTKDRENGLFKDYYITGELYQENPYYDGLKNGYSKEYYKNGKLSSEGWYEKGEQHGLWKYYFPNGILKNEFYFIDNEIYGWARYYNTDGKIAYKIKTQDENFKEIIYFDSTGNVITEAKLVNGSGSVIVKYPSGKIRFKGTIECEEYNDTITWYFSNGNVESKFYMFDGSKNGYYTNFYENGFPSSKGYYKNDDQAGEWTYYDSAEKDRVSTKGVFKNGKDGLWVYYWPNNKIKTTINYSKGDLLGAYQRFDDSGNLMIEYNFQHDELISYRYLTKDGSFTEPVKAVNGTLKITAFYQNGTQSVEENWLNGKRDGDQIFYYSNGKMMSKKQFIHGEQTGEEKEYYSNGKLKAESVYKFDNLDGESRYYRADGSLEKSEYYIMNVLNGWTKYYDKTGKEERAVFYWNDYQYE